MFATIHNLMNTYAVPRIVAVMAYRYMRGIDTVAEVVLYMPKMGHWYMFCDVVNKEGFEVGKPERKVEQDGRKFVFSS